ncbi:MAG: restriction endonuclease, partial [Armatimonadetes bacterium]
MTALDRRVAAAVRHFWDTRRRQQEKQRQSGKRDQGSRGAATGGSQLDGFIGLVSDLLTESGIPDGCIYRRAKVDVFLPGFFRPTKEWDLLVVIDGMLLASIEFKSHIGPSFGNNFNNRTEEALGSATDLWTAYREGAFRDSPRPWLGYFMLLESAPGSTRPVKVKEPHFEVFPEYHGASYTDRYRIFCQKLLRERLYDAACLLCTERESGLRG